MKKLVALVIVGALASGSAEAQKHAAKPSRPVAATKTAKAELPMFSFMGDDTITPTNRTVLNAATCTTDGNITDCSDYSHPKIANTDLRWLSIEYNNKLLYRVLGGTWTNRFSALLDAFSEKYGKPAIEIRKWQAKSGATFDNSVATWKFKDGFLELASLGPDLETSTFTFLSTANAPPREKPKIDF